MADVTPYINNIDPSFPVPGKNNNTQGFRSNFANIQEALTTLNDNFNSIAVTTVNINSPSITATQSLTTLESLYIGTLTQLFVTDVNYDVTVIGKNANGTDAAGTVAFLPNVITINTTGGQAGSDNSGTYFITSSPTVGILVGSTFNCPSSGTGPFTINYIVDNKIYYSGNGGLDPGIDISNPTFKKTEALTTASLEKYLDQGVGGNIKIKSITSATSTTTGALVVQGGAGVAKDLYVGGNLSIGGNIQITGQLSGFKNNFSTISTSTATSSFQQMIGGLIMAWGHTPNIQGRSSTLIYLPRITSSSTVGFPNATLNVQTTVSVPQNTVNVPYPIYDGDNNITSLGSTATTVVGRYSVKNVTSSSFTFDYWQEPETVDWWVYQPIGSFYQFIRRSIATTASVFWTALGY